MQSALCRALTPRRAPQGACLEDTACSRLPSSSQALFTVPPLTFSPDPNPYPTETFNGQSLINSARSLSQQEAMKAFTLSTAQQTTCRANYSMWMSPNPRRARLSLQGTGFNQATKFPFNGFFLYTRMRKGHCYNTLLSLLSQASVQLSFPTSSYHTRLI